MTLRKGENSSFQHLPSCEIHLWKGENIVGKGENAGYHHFLLFPQCCQKFLYPHKTSGGGGYTGISLSVHLCVHVSVSICVQNTSFCQSSGGSIKLHLVTALVFIGGDH